MTHRNMVSCGFNGIFDKLSLRHKTALNGDLEVRATERQLPSKMLEDFLAFAKECRETYQISYSCVGDEDKRLQDLLHALEFTDNKYDMHAEALRLWESRKERRRNKDTALLYSNLAQYFRARLGRSS